MPPRKNTLYFLVIRVLLGWAAALPPDQHRSGPCGIHSCLVSSLWPQLSLVYKPSHPKCPPHHLPLSSSLFLHLFLFPFLPDLVFPLLSLKHHFLGAHVNSSRACCLPQTAWLHGACLGAALGPHSLPCVLLTSVPEREAQTALKRHCMMTGLRSALHSVLPV